MTQYSHIAIWYCPKPILQASLPMTQFVVSFSHLSLSFPSGSTSRGLCTKYFHLFSLSSQLYDHSSLTSSCALRSKSSFSDTRNLCLSFSFNFTIANSWHCNYFRVVLESRWSFSRTISSYETACIVLVLLQWISFLFIVIVPKKPT